MFLTQAFIIIIYIILSYKTVGSSILYRKGKLLDISNFQEGLYLAILFINTCITFIGSLLIFVFFVNHFDKILNLIKVNDFFGITKDWLQFFLISYTISIFFFLIGKEKTDNQKNQKSKDYYIKESAYLTAYEIYSKLETLDDNEQITIAQLKHEVLFEVGKIKNRNTYNVDNYFIIHNSKFSEFKNKNINNN